MASQNALRDSNRATSLLGESSTVSGERTRVKVNPNTGSVLVDLQSMGGTATAALADDTSNPTVLSFGSYLMAYDASGNQWDRARSSATNADALSSHTQGVLDVMGHNYTYNGTTWDRIRSGQTSNSTTVTGFTNTLGSARYNATPTARTEGQFGNMQADVNGALNTNHANLTVGENQTTGRMMVEHYYTGTNITTATTTTVLSGAGHFHALIINKAVAAATITMYDNTAASGTLIGVITFGAALLTDPPLHAPYNRKIVTGLTIVTSAATDLTVLTRAD